MKRRVLVVENEPGARASLDHHRAIGRGHGTCLATESGGRVSLTREACMLDAFISDNIEEIILRARARVAGRRAPTATARELDRCVPVFFVQLTALVREMLTHGNEGTARSLLGTTVEAYARSSLVEGMSISQVVYDYGDLCQVVTELAIERDILISASEFRCFNRCLDDAIAQAVAEYERARDVTKAAEGVDRLGRFVHELRNILSTAMLSWDSIQRGVAPTGGGVGATHSRSLARLRDLVDRMLTGVRLDANTIKRERVAIAVFIEEEEVGAIIQAREHDLELRVNFVDPAVIVDIDRQVLAGALANLLQNAFKFTRPHTLVTLTVTGTETRVYIDVEDECGGLPHGAIEELFRPFSQRDRDRSGVGLGLSIARRAVEANGGELRAHDLPSRGCRFTIDLERSHGVVS